MATSGMAPVDLLAKAGIITSWPWRRHVGARDDLPRARAAERIESYVYGNVLVLAALALGPGDVATTRGALLVLGTAGSAFLAHLLAITVAYQAEDHGGGRRLKEAVRDGVPIATSGLVPASILAAGWLGWLDPGWALWLAIGVTVVRFAVLGSVVSYLGGQPSTWKNALIGFGLAAAGIVVAGIKYLLTH